MTLITLKRWLLRKKENIKCLNVVRRIFQLLIFPKVCKRRIMRTDLQRAIKNYYKDTSQISLTLCISLIHWSFSFSLLSFFLIVLILILISLLLLFLFNAYYSYTHFSLHFIFFLFLPLFFSLLCPLVFLVPSFLSSTLLFNYSSLK